MDTINFYCIRLKKKNIFEKFMEKKKLLSDYLSLMYNNIEYCLKN